MGFLTAIILYPVISTTTRHKTITYGLRIVTIPIVIILFVVLTRNFYTGNPYSGTLLCLMNRRVILL